MNKDTKLFLEHLKLFSENLSPIMIKHNMSDRTLCHISGRYYNSNNKASAQEVSDCFDVSMKDYFQKTSKASLYRMMSDPFWNNKPSFVSYYSSKKEANALLPYIIYAVSNIADLLGSEKEKLIFVLSKSTGLWQYMLLQYVSVLDIKDSTMKKMIVSKDIKVKSFAIRNAKINLLVNAFGDREIKNKGIKRLVNKRFKDAGIHPITKLDINSFVGYYNLSDVRHSVTKVNSKQILDFISENKEAIKEKNNNSWSQMILEDIIYKCVSNLPDSDVFSYINLDLDVMFKRKRLSEIIKK